jgi:capsular polysaccharide biosynthesis protein
MKSTDTPALINCTPAVPEETYINIHHIYLDISLVKYKINYSHFILDILRTIIEYLKNNNLTKDTLVVHIELISQYTYILSKFVTVSDLLSCPPDASCIDRTNSKYNGYKHFIDACEALSIQYSIPSKPRIIYVIRTGKRYIVNDSELIALLKSKYSLIYDIIPVKFETMSFDEQIKVMQGCKLLTGCHGAGFTNLIFMMKDAHLLELFPESCYIPWFKKMVCDKKGITHSYINGISIIKPTVSLEEYIRDFSSNYIMQASIRDIPFLIDKQEFIQAVAKILD